MTKTYASHGFGLVYKKLFYYCTDSEDLDILYILVLWRIDIEQ